MGVNLVTSWALYLIGSILACILSYEAGIASLVLFTAGGTYYRNKIIRENPSIQEIIGFNPIFKWASVAYMLLLSGMALYFVYELSEFSKAYTFSPFAIVILMFLPILVGLLRHDFYYYVNSKISP
ncbi:hypothetical protein [Kaarinaea lacus]